MLKKKKKKTHFHRFFSSVCTVMYSYDLLLFFPFFTCQFLFSRALKFGFLTPFIVLEQDKEWLLMPASKLQNSLERALVSRLSDSETKG